MKTMHMLKNMESIWNKTSWWTQFADVFENFRDKCIDINELNTAHFLSAPGFAWQACFKKAEVELELLTDNDMLMMI